MAAPLDAPLVPGLTLSDGMTIRVTALSAASGATVAGVVVSNVSYSVDPAVNPDAEDRITPTPLLVPADNNVA